MCVCGGVEKWDGTSKGEVGEAGEGASIHDIIMKIEDKHIPTKTIKLSSKGKRVFPVDTKTLEKIKKTHSLSKKANTAGDPETRKQYNKIRNQVKSLIRKLRKSYEKDLSKKAKTNPKSIWSYIKSGSSHYSDSHNSDSYFSDTQNSDSHYTDSH